MTLTEERTGAMALVQVWGKGFRVTEDTEEFQRFVPARNGTTSSLERALSVREWGVILEPLYKMTDREVGAQRALLFDSSRLMAVSFAKSEDRHGRPCIVLVASTAEISWLGANVGSVAARAVRLSGRLAAAYSDAFRGNPPSVAEQLRDGNFLPIRSFELDEEQVDVAFDWPSVLGAVKRWKGVTGVATFRLLSLGANVALGTRHEAERAQQQTQVDGYYDLREKTITPLTGGLAPWEEEKPVQPCYDQPAVQTAPVSPGHSLERIADALELLAEVGREIAQLLSRDKRRR